MSEVIDYLCEQIGECDEPTERKNAFFAAAMILADYADMTGLEALNKCMKDSGF